MSAVAGSLVHVRNGEAHLTGVCTLRMRSHIKLARILLANAITD
jgi:hypothetical protein